MRFLILTGLSGAGKTVAIRYLEDLGALCVDNLPPVMLVPFMETCKNTTLRAPMVAIAADVRSGEFFDADAVVKIIDEARMVGFQIDTLFVDASPEILVNRYKESRREHPLAESGISLEEAIQKERNMLQPLRETSNHLFNTTHMKARTLQKRLREILLHADEKPSLRVELMSFGFKRGIPRESDLVFDVRFLPNPFYIPELCRHTGLEDNVKEFVLKNSITKKFLTKSTDMLKFLIPHYVQEGKHRLLIAIGCTGGAHRSVAIAEYLKEYLSKLEYRVSITHRDTALEQAHWTSKSEYENKD